MRCTESNCPYRPSKLGAKAAVAMDKNGEIEADDCANILDSMMGEADEIEDSSMQVADVDEDSAGAAGSDRPAHDCIVNLWPYAHTSAYDLEVLTALACADKASAAVIVSTTAHPEHWLSCAHTLLLDTCVLTRRWSDHAKAHGYHIGRQLLPRSRRCNTSG